MTHVLPAHTHMHFGSVRTTIMVWLIFFNILGWPILGVVCLSPQCLKKWLGTTGMIESFRKTMMDTMLALIPKRRSS